jgi:hypothetical protein
MEKAQSLLGLADKGQREPGTQRKREASPATSAERPVPGGGAWMDRRERYRRLLDRFVEAGQGSREDFNVVLDELVKFYTFRRQHGAEAARAWAEFRVDFLEREDTPEKQPLRRIATLSEVLEND